MLPSMYTLCNMFILNMIISVVSLFVFDKSFSRTSFVDDGYCYGVNLFSIRIFGMICCSVIQIKNNILGKLVLHFPATNKYL